MEAKFKEITGLDFQKYRLDMEKKMFWYMVTRYIGVKRGVEQSSKITTEIINETFEEALEKIEKWNKKRATLNTWVLNIAIKLASRRGYMKRIYKKI